MVLFLGELDDVVSRGADARPVEWFFGDSLLLIAIAAALALYGFYISRGGEPLLGRRILD